MPILKSLLVGLHFILSLNYLAPTAVAAEAPRPDAAVITRVVQALEHETYHSHLASLAGSKRFEGQIIRDRFSQGGISLARHYIKTVLNRAGYRRIEKDVFRTKGFEIRRRAHGVNYFVEIPGRTRPEEIILVGAHYDSYGLKVKGANDNASGASAVLTLAEAFQRLGVTTERTIRFILFDAEELGYVGSTEHLSKAAFQGERIELFINLDMIGFPLTRHHGFFFDARGYLASLRPVVEEANAALPEPWRMAPRPAPRLYRSDHHMGAEIGFPSLGLVEHVLDHTGRTLTISPDYHTSKDVLEALNTEYAFGLVRYLASLTLTAADSGESWLREGDLERRARVCSKLFELSRK